MKRPLAFFAVAVMLALQLTSNIFAASGAPSADGIYEVPIQLWHASKDKESMGNKYVVQTARLAVKNGKKTITVAAGQDVSDLKFWYYTDGSVEGNTAEATKVSNVKIGGTTYAAGYTFTLPTDSEYVGVKFKASIMPVTPSARIKLDYANAKLISKSNDAATTSAKSPDATKKAQPAKTDSATKALAPAETASPVTGEASSLMAAVSEAASVEGAELVSAPEPGSAESTASESVEDALSQRGEEGSMRWIAIPIIVLIVIAGAFAAVVVVKKKK